MRSDRQFSLISCHNITALKLTEHSDWWVYVCTEASKHTDLLWKFFFIMLTEGKLTCRQKNIKTIVEIWMRRVHWCQKCCDKRGWQSMLPWQPLYIVYNKSITARVLPWSNYATTMCLQTQLSLTCVYTALLPWGPDNIGIVEGMRSKFPWQTWL